MIKALDKNALELAAIQWHKQLMGEFKHPWHLCNEAMKESCRKQARAAIEAYLITEMDIMPSQIIASGLQMTLEVGYSAPNPFIRNSAEFRYWQDGCRMGEQALNGESAA